MQIVHTHPSVYLFFLRFWKPAVPPCNNLPSFYPLPGPSLGIECQFTEWTAFTPCSASCGGGFRQRFRTVIGASKGMECTEHTTDVQTCNMDPCELKDPDPSQLVECAVSPWSEWSQCSATCGGGQHWRIRVIMQVRCTIWYHVVFMMVMFVYHLTYIICVGVFFLLVGPGRMLWE